ncbi:MAG: hypothetical protein ACYTGC_19710, partial [Planctomycetota bacterium]
MNASLPNLRTRRAFCLVDMMLCVVAFLMLLAVALPTLARMRGGGPRQSLLNLMTLGEAHALYVADWNGRQVTNVVDDLSAFGSSPPSAFSNYESLTGEAHPPIVLGEALVEGVPTVLQYQASPGNSQIFQPIDFETGFGAFRMTNARPLHDYVNGQVYDPVFFAPDDAAPMSAASPWFDSGQEFVSPTEAGGLFWSSYSFSASGMFDPQVMRADSAGGWQNPWSFDEGLTSPPAMAAEFADLKTLMMEHHWVQSPPADCNPVFAGGTYLGCEPYYFNHGLDSEPATLFHDGHVQLLPVRDVVADDETVLRQTGGVDGLWHRTTPFGSDGYFADHSYDVVSVS